MGESTEVSASPMRSTNAPSSYLLFSDLGATVHIGCVPDGLTGELPKLYCCLQSTHDWILTQGGRSPNGACVLDVPRHVVLFRQDGETIEVLNKAFACEPDSVDRLCEALFRAFPRARRIHIDVLFPPTDLERPFRVVEKVSHHVIDLPSRVDDYRLSLGKSTRKTLRSNRNRLHRDHPDVRTETIRPGERSRELVERLVGWKIQRFRKRGRVTYWESDPGLLERTASLLSRCGHCRITYIAGKAAAIHLCFRVGDTAYALEGAYDPAYDDYRLGFLTMYETVCAAIDAGATRFNALEGTAQPKVLLGARPVPCTRLSVYRSHLHRLLAVKEMCRIARRRSRLAFQSRRHALGQRVQSHPAGMALLGLVRRQRMAELARRDSKGSPSKRSSLR